MLYQIRCQTWHEWSSNIEVYMYHAHHVTNFCTESSTHEMAEKLDIMKTSSQKLTLNCVNMHTPFAKLVLLLV